MTLQRRLRRFYSDSPLPGIGGRAILSPTETRHLRDSIRLKEGDSCLVIDASGEEAQAKIVSFNEEGGTVIQVEERVMKGKVPSVYLRAFIALPQRGKMDELIEKAQELSVNEIYPLETERTVLKMKGDGEARAVARWKKISQEAAKQSGASVMTQVYSPIELSKIFKMMNQTTKKIILHPDQDALPFSDWIKNISGSDRVDFMIGPEGGFSEREVEAAVKSGFQKVHLGETLLKVDTAFLAAISMIRFSFL